MSELSTGRPFIPVCVSCCRKLEVGSALICSQHPNCSLWQRGMHIPLSERVPVPLASLLQEPLIFTFQLLRPHLFSSMPLTTKFWCLLFLAISRSCSLSWKEQREWLLIKTGFIWERGDEHLSFCQNTWMMLAPNLKKNEKLFLKTCTFIVACVYSKPIVEVLIFSPFLYTHSRWPCSIILVLFIIDSLSYVSIPDLVPELDLVAYWSIGAAIM